MRERCSYLLELHGVETSIIPLVVAPMVAAVLSMGTITIAVSLIWSIGDVRGRPRLDYQLLVQPQPSWLPGIHNV